MCICMYTCSVCVCVCVHVCVCVCMCLCICICLYVCRCAGFVSCVDVVWMGDIRGVSKFLRSLSLAVCAVLFFVSVFIRP